MANKTINIPDLGEAEDVEVIEICAKAGDQVNSEDPIIVLESDKAAMEIPASTIGKVISIEVSVGDTVNSGLPFLQIEVSDDAAEKDEKVPPNNTDKKNHTVNEESENIKSEQLANIEKPKNSLNTSNTNNANIYAGPAVRKLAREFGIELSQVQPTGPKNRIQKEDYIYL